MKKIRIFLQVIVGIAIIAFILYKIGINDVISALKKTDPLYFIMACLSYLCLDLVLATRLRYLLARIGHPVRFVSVFLSHMGGMIVGDITPGRGGYFLTPALLKKSAGTRITDGMACIFAPQGLEFILKVGGAVVAISYISTLSGISGLLLISAWVGVIILLFVGVLMLIISWHNENMSLKFISKLPFFNRFTEKLSTFKERSIQIKESINAILILYMIGWIFAGLQWFYLGKALGIELPFYVFFLLHPLITILMFAPTPAGLGVMELGAIGIFSLFGISSELAAAFSILVRVSILLVDLIGLKMVMSSLRDLEL
ncbi:MAG: lysylphosphatidylglycerol synthase transmembrane domain-containing protein [Candidatus Methanoperedens sp.]|nr:lysylphosphatidylglycerol synthase transmembrane domain-containing protein [Candidatus Methanoperedens sp.]MCZ7370153.1 lysylphosphatidylglycerol synthase transmembrane domain-containing protein [Candidatus Methanoperedens sp.]